MQRLWLCSSPMPPKATICGEAQSCQRFAARPNPCSSPGPITLEEAMEQSFDRAISHLKMEKVVQKVGIKIDSKKNTGIQRLSKLVTTLESEYASIGTHREERQQVDRQSLSKPHVPLSSLANLREAHKHETQAKEYCDPVTATQEYVTYLVATSRLDMDAAQAHPVVLQLLEAIQLLQQKAQQECHFKLNASRPMKEPEIEVLEDDIKQLMVYIRHRFLCEQGGESIHHEFVQLASTYCKVKPDTARLKQMLQEHYLIVHPENRQAIPVKPTRNLKRNQESSETSTNV
ncbi:hypothetical protein OS493_020135 [Desmophyllum pertusum]|uniref:Uncharacterized protein n=1 Tax=Desmophyllum pertusum TaxID=174260 RepID=A0A9X0D8V6_9CNID|nr:hypothetical protein OS493_020135 [Desmophyllum pertusum]